MSKYDDLLKKLELDAITIQYPKTIQKEDLRLPEWFELKKEYESAKDNKAKIAISIKNAILNQRRVYFCLTRKVLRKLIEEDNNWIKKPKFGNDTYKTIIKILTEIFQIFELHESGQGMRPDIFKLKDPDLLHYIIVDETTQLKATQDFVNKYSRKTDQGSDLVISNKEIVISNQLDNKKDISEKELIKILSKSNTLSIVNELKQYNTLDKKLWVSTIIANCTSQKANKIISELGLLN